MIVVSDTSPLSALISIGRASILQQLYQAVIIPTRVAEELACAHPTLPHWLKIVQPVDPSIADNFSTLDRGEAEAIALAVQLRADVLLIDERKGRMVARSEGLQVIGALGVVVFAKKRGLIKTVRPVLDELQVKAGFFVGERLRHEILLSCDEIKIP